MALGYVRPEANFKSLDELKQAIADDIAYSRDMLESKLAKDWTAREAEWNKIEGL